MPASSVTWIPAHPSYGAISMRRYWQALVEITHEDDRYRIRSVMDPMGGEAPAGIMGKAIRYWQRQQGYPRKIRCEFKGEIAHVLDHSWADMLAHVPQDVMKVVTVHDLIPLRFPGELTPAQLARFRSWVNPIKAADAVIADSHYTKQEVIDLLGVPVEKIFVVPCGVQLPAASDAAAPRAPKDGSFRIGSIGSTLERKNLKILPEALGRLKTLIGRPITLVRVGATLPAGLATELFRVLGDGHLIELGKLPDAALQRFYASIDVVVIPSLYEGFGLPVIEGMAARIPVVAANATSLPEVGGDAALYFDPHSPDELAMVLANVANEGIPGRQLEEGYERAKSLSWRNCLEGIFEVYDEVKAKGKS